ncbi:putative NBD/HSP70 family sugar kinase [Kribbella voronezhensis]|uniref:Putative NBD/HSP70 family sugar kinase n=1 Tax=Kribbella voronezhensis TaxID=2512212 RepID=A0A4R7TA37_9ACTN|nr:ROK family transcriptional regulator [Kribbella voronezhensis]TDU88841.1 putative NBD/HSP70 family sugar kinase [Kribbella voronezhensis]
MSELGVSGHTVAALRRLTHVSTLRTLRSAGAVTVAQLARAAGLSRPTVVSQLEELLSQGLVEEEPPAASGSLGRPAKRFRFRARAGFVAGIDIGAHTVRAALADLAGEVVASTRMTVDESASAADRLDVGRAALTEVLGTAEVAGTHVVAATVGTPGVVSPTGRVEISVLPQWSGIDLGRRLGSVLSCQVRVENDANLAAVAEHWRGAAREADNVLYVLAGMRTGAGLIINGALHRGRAGLAGEIGALDILGWDEAPRNLIRAAGDPADAEHAAQRLFAAAADGDRAAVEAVEAFARLLAQGIAAIVLTVDPEIVVIGGGVSLAGDSLLTPLRAQVESLSLGAPPMRLSELGGDAVVLGALRLALDDVDARLFSADGLLPG